MSDEPDYHTIVTAVMYAADGRITGHKTQGIYFTEREIAAGAQMLIVDGNWEDEAVRDASYVRVDLKKPRLAPRPVLDSVPEQATVPVNTEITVPKVPACTITFQGPVSGTHDHPGGSVKIGFSVPGIYTISFDPFPSLPCSFDMTVTQ